MKRYTNTGTQPILGNRMPGETWDGVVSEGEEKFLIGIGALRVLANDPPKKKPDSARVEKKVVKTAEQLAEEQEQAKRNDTT